MADDAVLVEHPDRTDTKAVADTPETSATTATTAANPTDAATAAATTEPTTEPTTGSGAGDDDYQKLEKVSEALQIVSIGTEENAYAFTFHEERLNVILSKIPPGWKVSIVSVVGAFRTGKSFLLSWFLRYLHHIQSITTSPDTVQPSDDNDTKWYEAAGSLGNEGFDWRGGSERNTTGIWMWSDPHFVQKESGEQIAVLLVDTQGMFDHETTMALTASIFGLSTLLSSYQIYNVDKRIQEDNLQQLALFSEYARTAMTSHDGDDEAQEGEDGVDQSLDTKSKPFQHIEFLVRDWQNYEDDEDYDLMEKEMDEYLAKAIADRQAKDLQDTREHIMSCFEKVTCYGLVHPGIAVTKKKFKGDVSAIDGTFLDLLDRYCKRVFDVESLAPKVIHGRELTAAELGSYMKAYANLFSTGAEFPEASTLLDATSTANNINAVSLSLDEYKQKMDQVAGPNGSYVKPEELEEHHQELVQKAATLFKSIAKFGSKKRIQESKRKLETQVEESFQFYKSLNEARNPLAGIET